MAFENGVNWRPLDPQERGRHATFEGALNAAFSDLTTQRNDFYDSLVDEWGRLFPDSAAKPGRYDDGVVFLYVRSAPQLFLMRPKLRAITGVLQSLPGAPKSLKVKLEIHSR